MNKSHHLLQLPLLSLMLCLQCAHLQPIVLCYAIDNEQRIKKQATHVHLHIEIIYFY